MINDYNNKTVWMVIKRFLLGWSIAVLGLIIISCINYKQLIINIFVHNTGSWINAMMPSVIIIVCIGFMIKTLFK